MTLRTRKGIALLIAFTLLVAGLLAVPSFAVYAAPDDGGRVPYQYGFEKLHTVTRSDTRISVVRNLQLELGEPLQAEGWLATDEGVSGYQYMWIPAGGGSGEWVTLTDAKISPRPDLAVAGVSYASGHSTAGFSFSITPPEELAEGYYDVYIRALDGMGIPCDLAALLNLRYGQPDEDDGKRYGVSIPRIQREGKEALAGDAAVTPEGIVLSEGGRVRLGDLNLTAFAQMRITYTAHGAANGMGEGRMPVLGLKSAGNHSYGEAGESYNLTDNLIYSALTTDGVTEVMEVDLTEVDYTGDVWLTGYLGGTVNVTEIEFVYYGYVTDRVAAKIYLSEGIAADYLGNPNRSNYLGVKDPVLGDVIRFEVKEDTNDPYVHFRAGDLLKDNGLNLDADEYKYMVLLYRAETCNNSTRMNLYLCSGPITSATEDCNQSVTLVNDGKWHYLLVDLSQKANWGGIINGWRFDYISAASDVGDAVEFATVQFFRTSEAAKRAASADPAKQVAYTAGDPPILRDMSEETEEDGEDFVIPPEDAFVVTEPATEPPTEPEPPADTTTEDTTPPTEPETNGKGCRSTLLISSVLPAICTPVTLLYKREKSTRKKENCCV